MTEPGRSGLTWTLLALRFLVELALFFAPIALAARIVGGVAGIALGVVIALAIAVVWGLLLSPKRRVDLPLPARVAIEAALFLAVAAALAVSGLVGFAIALLVVEVVVVVWLWRLGLPPGTDAEAGA